MWTTGVCCRCVDGLNNHDAEFGNGGVGKFFCSNNSLLFLINDLRNFCRWFEYLGGCPSKVLPLGGPTTRLLKLLGVYDLCPSLLGFLSLFLSLFLFLSLLLS